MVTGAIKNKVDKIWTDIWAGGITNPLTVIEQLTYLMFIRSLDEKELATEDFENMAGEKMEHIFPASAAGQSMRWSRFKDKETEYVPVEYPSTTEILADLHELEMEITKGLAELEEMV